MTNKPKGGRGRRAPYKTTMVRVPVPLKDQVQELINRYQEFIAEGGESLAPPLLLDEIATDKPVNKFEELEEQATQSNFELDDQKLAKSANKPVNNLSENADKPVNNLSENADKPVNNLKLMGQRQLARHLGITHQAIGRHKQSATFPSWAAKYDPEGVSWQYDTASKLFHPIADNQQLAAQPEELYVVCRFNSEQPNNLQFWNASRDEFVYSLDLAKRYHLQKIAERVLPKLLSDDRHFVPDRGWHIEVRPLSSLKMAGENLP